MKIDPPPYPIGEVMVKPAYKVREELEAIRAKASPRVNEFIQSLPRDITNDELQSCVDVLKHWLLYREAYEEQFPSAKIYSFETKSLFMVRHDFFLSMLLSERGEPDEFYIFPNQCWWCFKEVTKRHYCDDVCQEKSRQWRKDLKSKGRAIQEPDERQEMYSEAIIKRLNQIDN